MCALALYTVSYTYAPEMVHSGVARGGGLKGLKPPPPFALSGYAVNGSGQQAATA